MSVSRLVVVTLVLAASPVAGIGALAATASEEGKTPSGTCRPAESKTLAMNRLLRVYRVPMRGSVRGFAIQACVLSNGTVRALDDGDSNFVFLPPAISLRGRTVGYASTTCDFSAGGSGCSTNVGVMDPAVPPSLDPPISAADAGPPMAEAVKVGSLRHKPNGAIAWIQCPEPQTVQSLISSDRGPTCVRPGSFDRVYKLDAGARRRVVLDRGKSIHPGSLRLAGSRLSWRSGGRIRHAALR